MLVGCAGEAAQGGAPSGAKAQAAPEVRPVTLAVAELRPMSRVVAVQGTLAPDEQVVVSTRVPGYLASISVDLGSKVQKDQVIAQLDAQDYRLRVEQAKSAEGQARATLGLSADGKASDVDIEQTSAVRQARATLDEAKANLERAKQLLEKKLIPPAEFDATNTAYLRAEAALEAAREEMRTRLALLSQRKSEYSLATKQLSDTQIRAPLDGIVSLRSASAGEFLQAGAPVVTVVRIDPLRLRVEVPERDANMVEVGQDVKVAVEGDSRIYEGKVARVSPALNLQTRTLTVEAEIANPGSLRAGAFARAQIMVASDDVLTVPESAVVTFAGIEKVITVTDGKAVEKRITTGRRSEGFVEVLTGLEMGERVVVAPGNLQQGQPVDVRG